MRVLQVVPGISEKYGGPSVALTSLVRALAAHGVDTTLYTTDNDPDGSLDVPLNQPVPRDGAVYEYHRVSGWARRYGWAPSLWTRLRATAGTFDVVHIHWLYNFACVAAARAARAAGVPFVVQLNGSLDPHLLKKNHAFKRAYLATVGRPLLRHAAAIICTSEQERLDAAYTPRRREWIVPVGLDGATFEGLPDPGTFRRAFPQVEGPFLLFLGRLSRQKGLDLLIGAFARMAPRHPRLRLVLAGPDPDGYAAVLKTAAREAGVEDRVVFAGMLPHALKLAAFVDADLFVLPSYAENFGAVVTEALACGLPVVISSQVNIHRELEAAGVATVVQCSVESVAAGVESALADPRLRPRIATAGPALVRDRYTWDAIVPGLVEKYAEVMAAPSTRGSGVRTAGELA